MPKGFWYWLILVLWYLFGGWFIWWPMGTQGRVFIGFYSVLLVLLVIIGWQVFGNPFSALVR